MRILRLRQLGLLTLLAGTLLLRGPAPVQAAPAGPTTWTVLVGGEAEDTPTPAGPAGAWQFLRFYPEQLTINVGDTVVWKLQAAEGHSVFFPTPGEDPPPLAVPESPTSARLLVNRAAVYPQGGPTYDGTAAASSGVMAPGPSFPHEYRLTFTRPGTFPYLCTLHAVTDLDTGEPAGQIGAVIVRAPGTSYPRTPDQVAEEAAAQVAADTQAALAAEPDAQQVATRPGPRGTTIYDVNMGYTAAQGVAEYLRFAPHDLTIRAGDTVVWRQQSLQVPHTVTFTSGGPLPENTLVEPQPTGPPKLVLNPQVLNPAGGSVYHGQGYFNSGLIAGLEDNGDTFTYALTFDTPGTYFYTCLPHDQEGMDGRITVLAGTAPGMPRTGGNGALINGLWGLVACALGVFGIGLLCRAEAQRRRG